ncbi:MAG: response regulator transcription factor [Magnetococcales bacterium]|nr:response regulator transcription factor [Magnetococcales bacterium]
MRILVVEDDVTLGQFLKKKLVESGFAVDVAMDGEEGEVLGREDHYQAVVLDLGLPRKPGLEVLRSWRRQRVMVPVIVLTARNTWQERVEGIEAGADDYLGKPFHVEELAARLKAIIHRSAANARGSMIEARGLGLDEAGQTVRLPDGAVVQLSGAEFRLLRLFMLQPGRILSKEALMGGIYDYDKEVDPNVIEVYVNHLRKKMGKEVIRTLRWQGYRFDGLIPGADP